MIRNYAFAAFFSLLSALSQAQVAAGVPDGLKIGQKGISLNAFVFNFGDYIEKYDSLDFNQDGKFDASFRVTASNVIDDNGAGTGVFALNKGFELLVDSLGQILPLGLGDSIGPGQSWSKNNINELYYGIFNADFWGIGGHFLLGNWASGQSAFAGIRVITATQDTLYGWMKVTASVNSNQPTAVLNVKSDWAIQQTPSSALPSEPGIGWAAVFPNPARDAAVFKLSGQSLGPTSLRLFDWKGNLLREEWVSSETGTLQLNDLPVGIYIWELCAKDWVKYGKLVKQ